ncbi:MAG: helix-turn-helix transcriptional regulator [Laribacter sp.]|nr:helix-turn-helix transcriptional regulator [Laribacter sp.]MBP9608363.1 helix-turn-helix transcriptional regulator [Laribacter sp.]
MPILPAFEHPDFPVVLKTLRKQLGLSRTALAGKVGLSTAAIQRYEAQDASHIKPSREAYERLCAVLAELVPATPPASPAQAEAGNARTQGGSMPEPLSIPLAEAGIEQLIARAKALGARKVIIEF